MKRSTKAKKSSAPQASHRFPPQISMKPVQSRIIRFITSEAKTDYPISRFNMLKLMTATGTAVATGTTIWTGVKLRRVEMWAVNSDIAIAPGTMVSASVEWQASRGPSKLVSATGNLNQPAHLDSKPPKDSLAGFWSQVSDGPTVGAEILFYLTCTSGTVIDLHLNYVEANGSVAAPVETIQVTYVVAPNPNGVYFNRLDSQPGGYGIIPVDVQEARAT